MFCLNKVVKTQGTNKWVAVNPATIKEADIEGKPDKIQLGFYLVTNSNNSKLVCVWGFQVEQWSDIEHGGRGKQALGIPGNRSNLRSR